MQSFCGDQLEVEFDEHNKLITYYEFMYIVIIKQYKLYHHNRYFSGEGQFSTALLLDWNWMIYPKGIKKKNRHLYKFLRRG